MSTSNAKIDVAMSLYNQARQQKRYIEEEKNSINELNKLIDVSMNKLSVATVSYNAFKQACNDYCEKHGIDLSNLERIDALEGVL